MRLPWPRRSMSENWGKADMLCPPIQVRFVPEADISYHSVSVGYSASTGARRAWSTSDNRAGKPARNDFRPLSFLLRLDR